LGLENVYASDEEEELARLATAKVAGP